VTGLNYPKVYIVILNWNGLEDTIECLTSVYKLAYPDLKIIVVDNFSSDDSVEEIRKQFPEVVLIENNKNLGYAGGNNVGISQAMESGADYVWLLNNDTVVEPDTLAKLIYEAEMSPETGILSPVIRFYEKPEKIQFMGAYAVFKNYDLPLVRDPKELDNELVQRNLLLFGTALLIKKRVIQDVGYLSEKYFAYQEDYDYSLRTLKKNIKAKIVLDANVLHKDSRSTSKDSPIKVFLRTRNTYFLWRDNVHGFRRIFIPYHYVGKMISLAKVLLDEGNKKSFDACQSGVWAAISGKDGAYNKNCVTPAWFKRIFCFFVSWHPYFWMNLLSGNFKTIILDCYNKIIRYR